MARRKSNSPQKAAMHQMMQGYLKENDIGIKSGNDVNSIMRDMMSKDQREKQFLKGIFANLKK